MTTAAIDRARHALDAESQSVRWHLDVLGVDKISVHPSVAAIIDRERPVGMSRGEFLVRKTLFAIMAEASLRGAFLAVDADLRALVAPDAQKWASEDAVPDVAHSGAPRPLREAGNAARPASISDGAARELLGAKRTP